MTTRMANLEEKRSTEKPATRRKPLFLISKVVETIVNKKKQTKSGQLGSSTRHKNKPKKTCQAKQPQQPKSRKAPRLPKRKRHLQKNKLQRQSPLLPPKQTASKIPTKL